MKFYKLKISFEPDKIGFVRLDSKFDISKQNSATNLTEEALPDFTPEFPTVIISEKEIYASGGEYEHPRIISQEKGLESDFLYDGGTIRAYGYFISEMVKTILEKFNLAPHRYYMLNTINEYDGLTPKQLYYYLQILKIDILEWVDYSQSTLNKMNIVDFHYRKNLFQVTNKQEYINNVNNLKKGENIVFHKLAIKKEYFYEHKYDLIRLKPVFAFDIISEPLKEALEGKVAGLEMLTEVDLILT